jgi:hypothetical protein
VREFASVADATARELGLWVHLGEDIGQDSLQAGLRIVRIGTTGALNSLNFQIAEETARRNEVGRYYRIRTNANLQDGDYLLFLFDGNQIILRRGGGTLSLRQFIESASFTYSNYIPASGEIATFHVVNRAQGGLTEAQVREIVLSLIPPPTPTAPLVTITPITVSEGAFDFLQSYELWFHLDGIVEQNDGSVNNLHPDNLFLYAEVAPGVVQRIGIEVRPIRPNVWEVMPAIPNRGLPFARFVFPLDSDYDLKAFNPAAGGFDSFGTLRDYIQATNQQLAGHSIVSEEFGEALVVYVREQGRARGVER